MILKNASLFFALSLLAVYGCSKGGGAEPTPQNQCTSVSSLKANASANIIEKGQPLTFSSSIASGLTYQWKTPAGTTLTVASGGIQSVDFNDEGWYYLEAKNTCNEAKKDSFYLDVTIPQGTPSCTPAGNTISFTAAGHNGGTFITIRQGESAIPNIYELNASGGANDFTIMFHPSYKNNKQPENGIYTTGTWSSTGYPSFGSQDYDKVFLVDITYSPTTIFYRSMAGQKIYITRVNGKMKVTACNMALTGSSNGTPYSTNTTFTVTEQ